MEVSNTRRLPSLVVALPPTSFTLPGILSARGLEVSGAEASQSVFRGGSPLGTFWQISMRQVRDAMAAAGADPSAITNALPGLEDPSKWFNWPTTLSVWGRKK